MVDVLAEFASTPLKLKNSEKNKPSPWIPTGKFTPSKRPLEDTSMSFATPSKQRRPELRPSALKPATPSALCDRGNRAPHSTVKALPSSAKNSTISSNNSTAIQGPPPMLAAAPPFEIVGVPNPQSICTETYISTKMFRSAHAVSTKVVSRTSHTTPRTLLSMPSDSNATLLSRRETPQLTTLSSRRPLAPVSPQQPSPASIANQLSNDVAEDKSSKPSAPLEAKSARSAMIKCNSLPTAVPVRLRPRAASVGTSRRVPPAQSAVRARRRILHRQSTTINTSSTLTTLPLSTDEKPAVPRRFVQSKLTMAPLSASPVVSTTPCDVPGAVPKISIAASAIIPPSTPGLTRCVRMRKPVRTVTKSAEIIPQAKPVLRRRPIGSSAPTAHRPVATTPRLTQALQTSTTTRMASHRVATQPLVKTAGATTSSTQLGIQFSTTKKFAQPSTPQTSSSASLPVAFKTQQKVDHEDVLQLIPSTEQSTETPQLPTEDYVHSKPLSGTESIAHKEDGFLAEHCRDAPPTMNQPVAESNLVDCIGNVDAPPESEAPTLSSTALPTALPIVVAPESSLSVENDSTSANMVSISQFKEELLTTGTITGHVFAQCWDAGLDADVYTWQSSLFVLLVECEQLCLHDSRVSHEPRKVAFQCYDLSVVELQYVSERGTTQRVETILHNCERLVRRLSKLTQTQVHHILSALEKAGASAPSPTYRAAARYFRTVMDTSSQVVLSHISRLSNSLARHYLRVIFLYFDDRLSEDKASTVALPDHYAHQDLGAAIHRALDDRLLYETSQTTVKERYLYATSVNFLYQAIQLVQQTAKDAYLTSLIRKLQALCLRLIQHNCDDEAHLYPLASLATFEKTLQKELSTIDMNRIRREYTVPRSPLQSIPLPDQESTPLKERYRSATACFECKEAWKDVATTVQCAVCDKRYHLKCLYLSPTFRNLSGTYKCPHCL